LGVPYRWLHDKEGDLYENYPLIFGAFLLFKGSPSKLKKALYKAALRKDRLDR